MRRLGRWGVLAVLAWIAHVSSFAAQVEKLPCDGAMQSGLMIDCQACATCIPAPVSAVRTAGQDDNLPALISAPVMPSYQQTAINETTTGTAVRPPLPLRILYCRWLN